MAGSGGFWVLWYLHVIPEFRRLRWKGQAFKVNLGRRSPVSKIKPRNKNKTTAKQLWF